jgi:hypothetical protein
MKYILSFVLIVCCSITVQIHAQTGSLRGNIFDKSNGSALIGAEVKIDGISKGAVTDVDGFFVISNIPVGEYIVRSTYIGYDTVSAVVKIKPNAIAYQSLTLTEQGIELTTVNISASVEQRRSTVNISQISVSPKQIKALPSVGGEPDIVQYLQVIPGIISTGDQGGQIYIRGGAPVQNKIQLDGLNVFNPFHSVGFYSVFETELIKNVDVLTGGFGAEHGGRISAIVDIKTREGNRARQSGFISGGPFMVKGLVEGPISNMQKGGTSVSYVVSAKKSLLDKTSKSLYKYAASVDSIGLPFSFQDLYAKISVNTTNGSKFNIFGFDFNDAFDNPNLAGISWKNQGAGLNFNLVPTNSSIIVSGLIGFSKYGVQLDELTDQPRNSSINELTAKFDFSFFTDNSEIKYGIEAKGLATDFEFVNPFNLRIAQQQNTTELGAYLKYRINLGHLIIDPSVRVQYYSSAGKASLEPRFGLKYKFTDDFRLKLAAGRYTQNILSTSNERDVVNLFNGFLSGPEGIVTGIDGNRISNKLQVARHAIVGVEYDLTQNILFNVEGYYKNFDQLIVVNRNKLTKSEADYVVEIGDAYGIDFSLKYEMPRMYVWLTYSHGYVNRNDGVQEYPTVFDRRHNVNSLITYDLDKKGTWQVSGRWNLGSGFPFTKTKGFYNYLDFLSGVSTPYQTSNPNQVGIIYSDIRNGGRLPYYHRLDLSLVKKIAFSKNAGIEITASVTNVYNRPNIFYFDRISYSRVDQLPILPSLSAKLYY